MRFARGHRDALHLAVADRDGVLGAGVEDLQRDAARAVETGERGDASGRVALALKRGLDGGLKLLGRGGPPF